MLWSFTWSALQYIKTAVKNLKLLHYLFTCLSTTAALPFTMSRVLVTYYTICNATWPRRSLILFPICHPHTCTLEFCNFSGFLWKLLTFRHRSLCNTLNVCICLWGVHRVWWRVTTSVGWYILLQVTHLQAHNILMTFFKLFAHLYRRTGPYWIFSRPRM